MDSLKSNKSQHLVGRGAQIAPPNRFESVRTEADWEQLEHDEQAAVDERRIPTEFFADASRSLITSNDSPDIPLRMASIPTVAASTAVLIAMPGLATKTWA